MKIGETLADGLLFVLGWILRIYMAAVWFLVGSLYFVAFLIFEFPEWLFSSDNRIRRWP